MLIKQLSVFIENREGRLAKVLETLKKSDINIISLSLADTADYGLLRLIVSNPELGKDTLRKNGFSAMLTDVMAIKLPHRVGQLQELLGIICKASINVEYMYALSTGKDDASIVLKTSDVDKAVDLLEKAGVEIIHSSDIAQL